MGVAIAVKLLEHPNAQVRSAGVEALGLMIRKGYPVPLSDVTQLVTSTTACVHATAVEALCDLRLRLLVSRLQDPDATVRCVVVRLLSRTAPKDNMWLIEQVCGLLEHSMWPIQGTAIGALKQVASVGNSYAVSEVIKRLVHNKDEHVRGAAV